MMTADVNAMPAGPRVLEWSGERSEWDTFLSGSSGSTACHLAGWDAVMDRVLGNEVIRLVAVDDSGRWTAVLPLVRVRSRIFGHFLVSMPFLNDGGPVGEAAGCLALATAALRVAKERGVDLLELRSREALDAHGLVTSARKLTVMLDLPEQSETLWEEGFRAKLRSQIRRPMKEGMETRHGPEEVGPFYEVFARNMRDLGTPVLPFAFFETAVAELGAVTRVGCVYHRGRPVAAGFGLVWDGEFEMTWASSVRELDRLSPNMLLYWSFMERAIGEGLRRFNFGRCTRDSGTHRFKRQWGGEDVDLPWSQWSPRGVSSTPTPEGGIMSLAVKAWQKVPLPLANRIGPLVARRIP